MEKQTNYVQYVEYFNIYRKYFISDFYFIQKERYWFDENLKSGF